MDKIMRKQMLMGLYDLQADPNSRPALEQALEQSYQGYKRGMSFEDFRAVEAQLLTLENAYSDKTAADAAAVAAIIKLLEKYA